MPDSVRDYSWLPDHQLHVAATLGYADALIDSVGRMVADYTREGCFVLEEARADAEVQLRVTAIRPLPTAIARAAGDALNQLRAAIEHTLFAEVEFSLQRNLTPREAQCIEMPARKSGDAFDRWIAHSVRRTLAPLAIANPLAQRIRELQPFHRHEPDDHPLRVLAEHTNHAKHRSPAIATTRLGAVVINRPGLAPRTEPNPDGPLRPLEPGDVIAHGPVGVPVDIWPAVSIQRPHTQSWQVLGHELGYIEEWVRCVAIPHLIVGHCDVTPLPPQLDPTIGHSDIRSALHSAGHIPATKRIETRMQAEQLRASLADLIARHPNRPDPQSTQAWIQSLDDQTIIDEFDSIARWSRRQQIPELQAALDRIVNAIDRHHDAQPR